MIDLSTENLPFYWSTVFLRKIWAAGLSHVVISPGSRSTPLSLAAAAHPKLNKHVILDERSAAFTALGIGKATGNPALLICTSGTALANYFPAVIEARQSGIPMILATADRPPHLRATGANQAIDQLKIFGDYPIFFHEVGEPARSAQDLKRLKMLARQSFESARQQRGPAHLNFPFRKPLEPQPKFVREIEQQNSEQSFSAKDGLRDTYFLPEAVHDAISSAEQPLIIIGPTAPSDDISSISNLAQQLRCPVLSESTINTDYAIKGFPAFLRNSNVTDNLNPDIILRFGFQPTAKGLKQAFQRWQPNHHFHFASNRDWQDATFSESTHLPWLGRAFSSDDVTSKGRSSWFKKWKSYERKFEQGVARIFSNTAALTDGHIYRHFVPRCQPNNFIAVSNSFPARDIQLFGPQATSHPLFLNRGASGIDGLTSTALGISLGLNQSGLLFTGDLAFLHDTNALLNQQKIAQNLTVVVINNSGGSIFRMLPIEQHSKYFEEYFETPQSVQIGQLVQSYNIPYRLISTVEELHRFNLEGWQQDHNGLSIIECQTDADASMDLRKKCWNSIA